MGKFWDWHKRFCNTTILRVSSRDDGHGNKAFGVKLGGSHFVQWEEVLDEQEIGFRHGFEHGHGIGFRKRPKQIESKKGSLAY